MILSVREKWARGSPLHFAHLQRRVRWREVGSGSDRCLLSLQERSVQERQQRAFSSSKNGPIRVTVWCMCVCVVMFA